MLNSATEPGSPDEHFVERWHLQVDAGNLHDATPLMLAAEGGHKATWIALKSNFGVLAVELPIGRPWWPC